MFPVDALGTVGIGAAGGVMHTPVDVLPIPEIREKRSLYGASIISLRSFLDISSIGQIILYLKNANRTSFCRVLENIRRVEYFSLE
jgi:hypothetical protein